METEEKKLVPMVLTRMGEAAIINASLLNKDRREKDRQNKQAHTFINWKK